MGWGIGILAKEVVPILILVVGLVFAFIALGGNVRWALVFYIFLLPLTNVWEKMQSVPVGKDLNDILLITMCLGWFVGTGMRKVKLLEPSLLNKISIILILYTYLSLWRGYFYLHYFTPFDISDARLQDCKNFIILPILYFLTANNITDKKWVWRTVVVMAVSMLIVSFYTMREVSWFGGLVSRSKIGGTFQFLGPNEVAAFLNQYTILFISLFFGMKRKLPKILLLGIICSSLYCIIFLFSRGAYLALVVGALFLFSLKKRVLLIPLLLIVICWKVVLPQDVIKRIEMTVNEHGQLEESAESRLIIWQQSWLLFKENPVFGVGFHVFRSLGFELGDTHNIYMKILAEQGVIGFLIFIILIIMFLKQGWRLYVRAGDPLIKALGLGFVTCILVLIVNNLFGNRWVHTQISGFLWVFAGLVVRLNAIEQPAYEADLKGKQKKEKKRLYGYGDPERL